MGANLVGLSVGGDSELGGGVNELIDGVRPPFCPENSTTFFLQSSFEIPLGGNPGGTLYRLKIESNG